MNAICSVYSSWSFFSKDGEIRNAWFWWINESLNVWMSSWMYECVESRVNEWTNRWISDLRNNESMHKWIHIWSLKKNQRPRRGRVDRLLAKRCDREFAAAAAQKKAVPQPWTRLRIWTAVGTWLLVLVPLDPWHYSVVDLTWSLILLVCLSFPMKYPFSFSNALILFPPLLSIFSLLLFWTDIHIVWRAAKEYVEDSASNQFGIPLAGLSSRSLRPSLTPIRPRLFRFTLSDSLNHSLPFPLPPSLSAYLWLSVALSFFILQLVPGLQLFFLKVFSFSLPASFTVSSLFRPFSHLLTLFHILCSDLHDLASKTAFVFSL